MGFARLICAVCKGKRTVTVPYDHPFTRAMHIQTCTNCNGDGSIVTHTGAIGSYQISIDPAAKPGDETWATLWQRHDDGTIELKDSGIIPKDVSQ